jgi:hypothetical protein
VFLRILAQFLGLGLEIAELVAKLRRRPSMLPIHDPTAYAAHTGANRRSGITVHNSGAAPGVNPERHRRSRSNRPTAATEGETKHHDVQPEHPQKPVVSTFSHLTDTKYSNATIAAPAPAHPGDQSQPPGRSPPPSRRTPGSTRSPAG